MDLYTWNSLSGRKRLTKFIPRDCLNSTLIYILFSLSISNTYLIWYRCKSGKAIKINDPPPKSSNLKLPKHIVEGGIPATSEAFKQAYREVVFSGHDSTHTWGVGHPR